MSNFLRPHELQHARPPCPAPTPESTQTHVHWVHDAIQPFILWLTLLLLPPIPPSIRVFSNESALHIRWPKYWSSASASVPPMNTQDWSPLGWTGWISLQFKGFSRVFSNTTVQKHRFFVAKPFYGPPFTSIHDYWKNHDFDYMNLCCQSHVSVYAV